MDRSSAFHGWCRDNQNESELITSPPSGVAKAYQTGIATVDLTNFTEPSIAKVLTPPGWSELALIKVIVARPSCPMSL